MLTDEKLESARAALAAGRLPRPGIVEDMLDEIDRLRAENERLRAALLGLERDSRAERIGRAAILAVDNGWSAHEVYTEIVDAMEATDE